MDKSKKYLAISFIVVLIAVIILSFVGMFLLKDKPVILQGQIEATEIRISGKLPGRIDTFLVKEGQNVKAGDTLVVINSPEALAKYQQVNALESIARFQNQKVDGGTRKQIIATVQQLWNKSKSDLELAKTTYNRIEVLYRDSVVSSQRRDEVKALYDAAVAGERAAWNQYQMALDGAQIQDRESARSLVNAAKGTVEEVAALLQDARLTAPESGQISTIFPKRGELVGAGMPIMNLIVLDDVHIVLNVREDCLPFFPMGGTFVADIPAIDKKNIEFAVGDMTKIAGQKPMVTRTRKAIANFKIRENMPIGCMVTLRGERMYDFLDRLVTIAFPRVRDFRGVSGRAFDGRGNYNIGLNEQIIFPEIEYDKIDSIRGMNISITTTAKTDEEAKAFIADECGFAPEKIHILHEVHTYEVNKHRRLRKSGTFDRTPMYESTDWNYVRFDCACFMYELVNGELRFYCC